MKRKTKIPLKLQFFAEDGEKPKDDDTSLSEPMQALQRIMGSMEGIENFTDDFDIIRSALEAQTSAGTPTGGNEDNTDWKASYDKLKAEYVKRFGEYTEQRIEVEFGSENKPVDYANIDFSYGLFDGKTE